MVIDPKETRDGLRLAGPVNSVGVGEFVCVRPDGKVGVMGDERRGGWAERLLLGSEKGSKQRE
jgi:hypothetical protein